MNKQDPVVIVSMARTPLGGFQGALQHVTATELGATAIRAAVARAQLAPEAVQEVIFGCVLPAGLGQAPARQAALGAGLAESTVCSTVNKMCGSGMQTVIMAHDALLAGHAVGFRWNGGWTRERQDRLRLFHLHRPAGCRIPGGPVQAGAAALWQHPADLSEEGGMFADGG